MTSDTLKLYAPCPRHTLWHDRTQDCLECIYDQTKRRTLKLLADAQSNATPGDCGPFQGEIDARIELEILKEME
jgi:hypothetical protein